jgi:nicotinate phosphoribosyltransferase
MLTDTYTVKVFFDEFLSDPERASRWNALRHDSGDSIEFAKLAKSTWEKVDEALGRPKGERKGRVIFSDGLDVDSALSIWRQCEEIGLDGRSLRHPLVIVGGLTQVHVIFTASFGIGTHLTNDFTLADDATKKSKPLNIVIKLRNIDGIECVKLSDDRGKWTGDEEEVQRCRRALKLV